MFRNLLPEDTKLLTGPMLTHHQRYSWGNSSESSFTRSAPLQVFGDYTFKNNSSTSSGANELKGKRDCLSWKATAVTAKSQSIPINHGNYRKWFVLCQIKSGYNGQDKELQLNIEYLYGDLTQLYTISPNSVMFVIIVHDNYSIFNKLLNWLIWLNCRSKLSNRN